MKKILAITLTICMICLSGCESWDGRIEVEQSSEHTKITLDNFEGMREIEIAHDTQDESGLYYETHITVGDVTVYYDQGCLWDEEYLFTASANGNVCGGGHYIDNNTSKITVIIRAEQAASGEILLGFSPFK